MSKISEFTLLKQILQFIWHDVIFMFQVRYFFVLQIKVASKMISLSCISFIIKYTLRFLLQSPYPMKLFLLQSPHPIVISFSSIIHEVLSKTASYNIMCWGSPGTQTFWFATMHHISYAPLYFFLPVFTNAFSVWGRNGQQKKFRNSF